MLLLISFPLSAFFSIRYLFFLLLLLLCSPLFGWPFVLLPSLSPSNALPLSSLHRLCYYLSTTSHSIRFIFNSLPLLPLLFWKCWQLIKGYWTLHWQKLTRNAITSLVCFVSHFLKFGMIVRCHHLVMMTLWDFPPLPRKPCCVPSTPFHTLHSLPHPVYFSLISLWLFLFSSLVLLYSVL